MRKIDNYFGTIPPDLQNANLLKKRQENAEKKGESRVEKRSIIEEVLTSKRVEPSSYNLDGVKMALLNHYGYTCAFCEKRISHHDDIEHFRPKHGITDVNKIGYYWLGFVWSNLLIACKDCNSDFKRNHFPIENERDRVLSPPAEDSENNYTNFIKECQIDSQNLTNEKPLLLHPVLDSPDEHLIFHENGRVSAKNNSPKGKKSIEHYGLDN